FTLASNSACVHLATALGCASRLNTTLLLMRQSGFFCHGSPLEEGASAEEHRRKDRHVDRELTEERNPHQIAFDQSGERMRIRVCLHGPIREVGDDEKQ